MSIFTLGHLKFALTMLSSAISGFIKQRHLKVLHAELAINNIIHIDAKLEKYRPVFTKVRRELNGDLDRLSYEAMILLNTIIRIFDSFDIESRCNYPLRHAVYKCAGLLFLAKTRKLGREPGRVIFNDFLQIKFLEDNLNRCAALPYLKDFERAVDELFSQDHAFAESDLHNNAAFCGLFKSINDRFDSSREIEFIQTVQERFAEFDKLFNGIKPKIKEAVKTLQGILDDNEYDEVSIDVSPNLAKPLRCELAALDTLSWLSLERTDRPEQGFYSTVTWGIQTCTVLYTISQYDVWRKPQTLT